MDNILTDKRSFRDLFCIPKCPQTNQELTYLCGHSLGLQPKNTRNIVENELKVWQDFGVEGYLKQSVWFNYHEKLHPSLAKIVGAKNSEVVAMNSLTANLHFMLMSFYSPRKNKYKIITDAPCFSSDKYCLDSIIRFHGFDPHNSLIKIQTMENKKLINTEQFIDAIEKNRNDVCLCVINAVNYLSGQLLDIKEISDVCAKHNIILGLDLAHAIGNVPLDLHKWGVDFGVWCSYKYLNGGPGTIGGCFINEKHHHSKLPRVEGWWGTDSRERLKMKETFDPIPSAESWQLSSPPILTMAALKASLDIFDNISLSKLHSEGSALTCLFDDLILSSSIGTKITIINNKKDARGNMLSAVIEGQEDVKDLQCTLRKHGIVLDSRPPNILRFSFCPLYNDSSEVNYFVKTLESCI